MASSAEVDKVIGVLFLAIKSCEKAVKAKKSKTKANKDQSQE